MFTNYQESKLDNIELDFFSSFFRMADEPEDDTAICPLCSIRSKKKSLCKVTGAGYSSLSQKLEVLGDERLVG